jgi:hypothetical protein
MIKTEKKLMPNISEASPAGTNALEAQRWKSCSAGTGRIAGQRHRQHQ